VQNKHKEKFSCTPALIICGISLTSSIWVLANLLYSSLISASDLGACPIDGNPRVLRASILWVGLGSTTTTTGELF